MKKMKMKEKPKLIITEFIKTLSKKRLPFTEQLKENKRCEKFFWDNLDKYTDEVIIEWLRYNKKTTLLSHSIITSFNITKFNENVPEIHIDYKSLVKYSFSGAKFNDYFYNGYKENEFTYREIITSIGELQEIVILNKRTGNTEVREKWEKKQKN